MDDRDYFAAAALTRGMGVLGYEQIAKSCYEMADAMLRERERTNHDAVPAAKAEEPESSVPLESSSALANTSEPVAWVAFATDGSESSAVYSMREQAQAAADDWGWMVVPLYPFPALWPADEPQTGVRCANAMADEILRLREAIRRLADQDATLSVCDGNVTVTVDATLTDEEREAVGMAYSRLTTDANYEAVAATLRGLLERTK
jgi:hypothetical protein